VSLLRPALVATVVTCAALVAGCHSGGKSESAKTPARTTGAAAPPPSADACPTHTELAKALKLGAGDPKGVMSPRGIVCRDGWAAIPLRYPGSDPAWAVIRQKNGRPALVTEGTDGLCEGPEMKNAPAEVKKALGPYC
jgi:hypothetical protein